MFAALLTLILAVQVPPVEPDAVKAAHDARQLAQDVRTAARDARMWAYYRMTELYPLEFASKQPTKKKWEAYHRQRSACWKAFRDGAYRQVCKELDITPEQLIKIVGKTSDTIDPRVKERPRGQSPEAGRFGIASRSHGHDWFVAEKVRLSDADAKLYQWKNPPEEKPKSKDPRAIAIEGMLPPER